MNEYSIVQNDNSSELILSGPLTLPYALLIKESFEKLLTKEDNLIINHSDAKEFDISYLQLLLAAGKSAKTKKKNLIIKGECPEGFASLVAETQLINWSVKHSSNGNSGGEQ